MVYPTNTILKSVWDTPWKASTGIKRYLTLPWTRLVFAFAGIDWGHNWKLYGIPILQIHRKGHIRIGDHLQLRSSLRSNPLGVIHPVIISVRDQSASLTIGHHFSMTGGSITAEKEIVIGDRVSIGANTIIVDSDFHPLDLQLRLDNPNVGDKKSVIIENDVFIGMSVLILKGSHIGAGSIIGAGSVVTGYIPPGVVAAGNPARIIHKL